jgi:hypothetical protein
MTVDGRETSIKLVLAHKAIAGKERVDQVGGNIRKTKLDACAPPIHRYIEFALEAIGRYVGSFNCDFISITIPN